MRFNLDALPAEMLTAIAETYGSADAPEGWNLVTDQLRAHVQPDGSVALPSVAVCARAVNPGG